MSYVKIRPRRGTSTQWEYANPILSEGEMAFEVPDTGVGTGPINIKQGDGQSSWVNLPYAFNAAVLNKKVDDLTNTVATYDSRITELTNDVTDIQYKVQNIRKIDIQATTPSDNLITGQIWLNVDMVTGTISITDAPGGGHVLNTITLEVMSSIRVYIANTLSACDSIVWTSSDDTLVSVTDTSMTGANITGKLSTGSGSVRVTAAAKVNNATVYTASVDVTVAVGGGLTISPANMRLVIGQINRFSLTDTITSPPHDIVWTSSAPYFAAVEDYGPTYADVKGYVSGSVEIYARAQASGSYIATAKSIVTVVGMSLNQTSAIVPIADTIQLELFNSMIADDEAESGNGDYTGIEWSTSGANVANITASSRDGATVIGVSAGSATITAQAYKMVAGTKTFVQKVECIIGVTGAITLNENAKSMQVGETGYLTFTNTLGEGNYDTITWESSDPTIVRLDSGIHSQPTMQLTAVNAGNSVITVSAYKNSALVDSDSCVVTSIGRISIDGGATRTIIEGASTQLTCTNTLNPSQYSNVRWTVDAADVVTIVAQSFTECTIEGRSVGTANVTVRATDMEGGTVSSSSVAVTVSAS